MTEIVLKVLLTSITPLIIALICIAEQHQQQVALQNPRKEVNKL